MTNNKKLKSYVLKATINGNLKKLKLAVERHGSSLNYSYDFQSPEYAPIFESNTPLHKSAFQYLESIISNPLKIAAAYNRNALFKYIFSKLTEEEIFALDEKGETIYGVLSTLGCIELLEFLPAHKSINALNIHGSYVFDTQWSTQNPTIIKILIDKGADVNIITRDSLLHNVSLLASYNSIEVINLLTDNGVDVNIKECGQTPLHWAMIFLKPKSLEVIQLLIDKGADVNAWCDSLDTPLVTALKSDRPISLDIVKLLLKNGANIGNLDLSSVYDYGNHVHIPLLDYLRENHSKKSDLINKAISFYEIKNKFRNKEETIEDIRELYNTDFESLKIFVRGSICQDKKTLPENDTPALSAMYRAIGVFLIDKQSSLGQVSSLKSLCIASVYDLKCIDSVEKIKALGLPRELTNYVEKFFELLGACEEA